MPTIIVPVDFSKASVNAAYYACDLALLVKADVILMHTVTPPVTFSEMPFPDVDYKQLVADARDQANILKGWLAKYVNEKLPITISISTGSMMDELKLLAGDEDVFAVVMAAQGAGAAEAFLLGSYTQAAAKTLHCPLVIVPPEARYDGFRHVALACDMKDVAATLPLKKIRRLFSYIQPELDVVYIRQPDQAPLAAVAENSSMLLNDLAAYHPEIKVQSHDSVEAGIHEFVQYHRTDLLLVIMKEYRFPESLFHKSVHKRLIMHSKVPLMLLRK